jgi:hypothetical protein
MNFIAEMLIFLYYIIAILSGFTIPVPKKMLPHFPNPWRLGDLLQVSQSA